MGGKGSKSLMRDLNLLKGWLLPSFGVNQPDVFEASLVVSSEEVYDPSVGSNNSVALLDFSDSPNKGKGKLATVVFRDKYHIHKEKPFLSEVLELLIQLQVDCQLQIFMKELKKSFFTVGGQLVCFGSSPNLRPSLERIKHNFKQYGVSICLPSKWQRLQSLGLVASREYHPWRWFRVGGNTLADLFTLPSTNEIFRLIHPSKVPLKSPEMILENNNPNICSKIEFPIGHKLLPGLPSPPILELSIDDLTNHFCCFGQTSMGKSRLISQLLTTISIAGKKFLIFDTKGEYLRSLCSLPSSFLYFKIGDDQFPLGFNIFEVPPGLNPDDHCQFLFSLLIGVMGDDVSPQMSRLVHKAVKWVVTSEGQMSEFLSLLSTPSRLGLTGSYLDLSGTAAVNRLLPLSTGPGKKCFFASVTTIDFQELARSNVVVDLGHFELIESTLARKVFVNTFLHFYLHAIQRTTNSVREVGDINNFVIVEEIQKLAPPTFLGKNIVQSYLGTIPWTARAYGVSLGYVGTDPDVEQPILTNSGVMIAFYSKYDRRTMSQLLGITLEEYNNLLPFVSKRRRFVISCKGHTQLGETFETPTPSDGLFERRLAALLHDPEMTQSRRRYHEESVIL